MSDARRQRRDALKREREAAPIDAPGPGPAAPNAPWPARALEVAALLVVTALYALLKTHALHAAITDENIYFYGAELVARGKLPYRDFFFAHPPLHLIVPALVFKLAGGFSLTLGKAIPACASIVSGLCLWALARRHLGRVSAMATLLLFWFALEQLKASSDMTGVNLSTAWMCAGLLVALSGRWFIGGVLLGCAAGTGLYVAAGLATLGAFSLLLGRQDGRKPWLRLASGFALAFGLWNLTFWILGGDTFLEGVYRYHLLKPEKDLPRKPWQVLYQHALQLWAAVLAAGLLGRRIRRLRPGVWNRMPEGVAALALASAAAFCFQLASLAEFYDFYFVVALPAIAVAGGWFVGETLVGAVEALNRDDLRRGALFGGALLVLAAAWPIKDYAQRRAYPDEMQSAGQRNTYVWTDPPVLPRLGFVVRWLFWSDFRIRGQSELGVRHYLWNKKRVFAEAPAIGAYVRENSAPGETIAGTSMVAPLVALLSGRDIAADEIDTNAKRFKTGLLTDRAYFDEICRTPVRFLVSSPRSYFEPERIARLKTVASQFTRDRTFVDRSVLYQRDFPIVLFRRTTPAVSPPYCRWLD